MKHLDLFSGIGGFALATEMVWENVEHTFCDIEPFAQAVLRKHWPTAKIYGDIKQLKGSDCGTVDLLTGGFPCQPFSNAGERRGTEDDRHLWPEMLRVIREVSPRWVIGENVDGLTTWNGGLVLETVAVELEGAGYEVQPFIIPAAAVQAPHGRDRVWFVAHADSLGRFHGQTQKLPAKERKHALCQPGAGSPDVAHAACVGIQGRRSTRKQKLESYVQEGVPERGRPSGGRAEWPVEPSVGRVAHGVPNRVDRIKALGNAIVPQVAAEIMRAIAAVDD